MNKLKKKIVQIKVSKFNKASTKMEAMFNLRKIIKFYLYIFIKCFKLI